MIAAERRAARSRCIREVQNLAAKGTLDKADVMLRLIWSNMITLAIHEHNPRLEIPAWRNARYRPGAAA